MKRHLCPPTARPAAHTLSSHAPATLFNHPRAPPAQQSMHNLVSLVVPCLAIPASPHAPCNSCAAPPKHTDSHRRPSATPHPSRPRSSHRWAAVVYTPPLLTPSTIASRAAAPAAPALPTAEQRCT
eukprot:6518360-Prymnesium_polylepis.1